MGKILDYKLTRVVAVDYLTGSMNYVYLVFMGEDLIDILDDLKYAMISPYHPLESLS